MSTVIVGFNVSCGSESSPGLDTPQYDWLRISIKYPDMPRPANVDVLLHGKFDPDPKAPHGDTNRTIAQKIAAAIGQHVQSQTNPGGDIPAADANQVHVETDPDPKHPNTAPGRIVAYNADEIDAVTTNGKLYIVIFDPNPPRDRRKKVRVITPSDPPKLPPPPPPPPPHPKRRGAITPYDPPVPAARTVYRGWEPVKQPTEPGKDAPRLPDDPYGLNPGGEGTDPLREKFGGGGWQGYGWILAARSGDLDSKMVGSTDSIARVQFPYVTSSPADQLAAIAKALAQVGIATAMDGDWLVELPGGPGSPYSLVGISTAFDPSGRVGAFPWEIVLAEASPSVVLPSAIDGIDALAGPSYGLAPRENGGCAVPLCGQEPLRPGQVAGPDLRLFR